MDRDYWKTALQEALAELDAARGKVALDAAARKVMRARTELKRMGAPKRPKRKSNCGAASADAAS
jgi:hypothetical protein